MSETRAAQRPAELTVIVFVNYVAALGSIVLGVALMLARYLIEANDEITRAIVTISGASIVLVGFMIIAVASGIARGDRSSRLVGTVLLALSAALSILVVLIDREAFWTQLINGGVTLGTIVLMWTGRASRFFANSSA